MAKPFVSVIPPGGATVQIPLGGGSAITLVNLSDLYGIDLCESDTFEGKTTWPLDAGMTSPQVGINTLFARNSNVDSVTVLVLPGIVPVSIAGANERPYTHLLYDEHRNCNIESENFDITETIQPTSTYIIVAIRMDDSEPFSLDDFKVVVRNSTDASGNSDVVAYYDNITEDYIGGFMPTPAMISIPAGYFDTVEVSFTISFDIASDKQVFLSIFETNTLTLDAAFFAGSSSLVGLNLAKETGGNLADIATDMVTVLSNLTTSLADLAALLALAQDRTANGVGLANASYGNYAQEGGGNLAELALTLTDFYYAALATGGFYGLLLDPRGNPNATQVIADSGNQTNTDAVATLTPVTGTQYLTGVEFTASGSTTGSVVNASITDGTWVKNYAFVFPANVLEGNSLVLKFDPPLVASASATPIVVTLPAGGAGSTNAVASAEGYYV